MIDKDAFFKMVDEEAVRSGTLPENKYDKEAMIEAAVELYGIDKNRAEEIYQDVMEGNYNISYMPSVQGGNIVQLFEYIKRHAYKFNWTMDDYGFLTFGPCFIYKAERDFIKVDMEVGFRVEVTIEVFYDDGSGRKKSDIYYLSEHVSRKSLNEFHNIVKNHYKAQRENRLGKIMVNL